MKKISSVQNNLIKNLVSLQQKKNIVASELCFLESQKVVFQYLYKDNIKIQQVFVTEKNIDKLNSHKDIIQNNNIEVFVITEEVANKIATTKTNSGVFATAKLPEQDVFDKDKKFLVLDNVQDPTNVGALARSALAFGYQQIILINSAYPYTPKMIRTSMGYVFDINFFEMGIGDLTALQSGNNLHLICADMDGEDLTDIKKSNKAHGLVLGNEGAGVSHQLKSMCNQVVKIDMSNNVESLNVAVSGSIIMFALK